MAIAAVPADLVRTRPEIAAAEQGVLQAAAEAGVARADLYPRLSLTGALTLTGDILGAPVGGRTLRLGGGPALSLPLFDWGARRAVVTARDAQLAEAVAAYRQAVLDGVAEVEDALTTLQSARARIAELSAAVAAARRASANADRVSSSGLVFFEWTRAIIGERVSGSRFRRGGIFATDDDLSFLRAGGDFGTCRRCKSRRVNAHCPQRAYRYRVLACGGSDENICAEKRQRRVERFRLRKLLYEIVRRGLCLVDAFGG